MPARLTTQSQLPVHVVDSQTAIPPLMMRTWQLPDVPLQEQENVALKPRLPRRIKATRPLPRALST
jgi:hypothetical protein